MEPLKLLLCAEQFNIRKFTEICMCPMFGNTNGISYVHNILHKFLNMRLR
jgi:hypothetical protein